MDLQDVIIKPIISEKSMSQAANEKFTFKVASKADKKLIKCAIEKKFKVNVLSVSTSMVKGKGRKVGTRRKEVVSSSWKKATVKVAKGQKIDLFDVGGK